LQATPDSVAQSKSLTHMEAVRLARSHEPVVAWPTVLLVLAVSLGFAWVAYLAAAQLMPLWLAFPLNILLAYSAYTPVHEACHRNVVDAKHRHAWLNDAVGILAAFPLFGSFHLHQLTHLAHHAHTNDPEKDPDHIMASSSLLSMLGRGLLLPFVHIAAGVKMARARSDGMRRLVFGMAQMGLALAGMFWLAWRFDALAAVLCTLGSALMAGLLLAIVFDWLPHHPHTSRERWEHTRVVTFSPWVQRVVDQLLLGQSYHLVHHLYPRVPYYRYKSVFMLLRGFFESNGALIYPASQAGFKTTSR
jgi:beta-carotene hydroxylase